MAAIDIQDGEHFLPKSSQRSSLPVGIHSVPVALGSIQKGRFSQSLLDA